VKVLPYEKHKNQSRTSIPLNQPYEDSEGLFVQWQGRSIIFNRKD